jgi:hypothetical protein
MTGNPEDWQNYPYLVAWVNSANKWAEDYEIYEFMPADDKGLDPSGRFSKDDGYPGCQNSQPNQPVVTAVRVLKYGHSMMGPKDSCFPTSLWELLPLGPLLGGTWVEFLMAKRLKF